MLPLQAPALVSGVQGAKWLDSAGQKTLRHYGVQSDCRGLSRIILLTSAVSICTLRRRLRLPQVF